MLLPLEEYSQSLNEHPRAPMPEGADELAGRESAA